MALFDAWCTLKKEKNKRKRLWKLTEKDGGRDGIRGELVQIIRSHSPCVSIANPAFDGANTRQYHFLTQALN